MYFFTIMPLLLFVLVILTVFYFWITEFVQLMLLTEQELGGPHDKLIWAAAFIVLFFIAPFAFRAWRHAVLAARPQPAIRVEYPNKK